MNKIVLFALSLILIGFSSCNNSEIKEVTSLDNELDSASYALGVGLGTNMLRSGLEELNYDVFVSAFKKAVEKDSNLLIDNDAANKFLQTYFQSIQAKKAESSLGEETTWFAENAKVEGITTTESGLQYQILTEGTGEKPALTDKVSVHYHGTLLDGTVFDSSVERGKPASFGVGQVIKGWTEGLQLMPVGSKWKFFIPSGLAYGPRGAGNGQIGPNATLVFEVELLAIEAPVEVEPAK